MKNVLKGAVVVWLAVGLLLLLGMGYSSISHRAKVDDYKGQLEQVSGEIHFWRVIADVDHNDQGGMLNKLARDLRDLPIDQVRIFKGDANRYGGIADELGYDPFAGINCSECGLLKENIAEAVVLARTGHLDQVIGPLTPREPGKAGGPNLDDMAIWLLVGPIAIGIIIAVDWRHRQKRYQEMSSEMHLIGRLDRALEQGGFDSPEQRYELQSVRDKLMTEIDTRVRYSHKEKQRLRMNDLSNEARSTLEAIEEGNKALN